MANKFLKQSKLPWTSKDVEDAIEQRLGDLAKLNQEFEGARTDARSIRQRLFLQTTGITQNRTMTIPPSMLLTRRAST